MITEEKITKIFHEGRVVDNALVAPLFIKFNGETYKAKGTMRSDLACKQCAFNGGSCPRDLDGNRLCDQMETIDKIVYFERC